MISNMILKSFPNASSLLEFKCSIIDSLATAAISRNSSDQSHNIKYVYTYIFRSMVVPQFLDFTSLSPRTWILVCINSHIYRPPAKRLCTP